MVKGGAGDVFNSRELGPREDSNLHDLAPLLLKLALLPVPPLGTSEQLQQSLIFSRIAFVNEPPENPAPQLSSLARCALSEVQLFYILVARQQRTHPIPGNRGALR